MGHKFSLSASDWCLCMGSGCSREGRISLRYLLSMKLHLASAVSLCLGLLRALGLSCFDFLISPSSAPTPEFPSSESLGWFASSHFGVWVISRAW